MAITNIMIIEQNRLDLILAKKITVDEDIHTFQHWKNLGFSVRKGEKAVAKFPIWKMGTRKNKETKEEEETGHLFMKVSAFFSSSQVEPLPARA